MIDIGSLVVCITDWEHLKQTMPYWYYNVPNKPVKGLIYTIRGFSKPVYCEEYKETIQGIFLEEIYNPAVNWEWGLNTKDENKLEGNFDIKGFVPVQKPSIENIRELLTKPPSPELLEEYEKA